MSNYKKNFPLFVLIILLLSGGCKSSSHDNSSSPVEIVKVWSDSFFYQVGEKVVFGIRVNHSARDSVLEFYPEGISGSRIIKRVDFAHSLTSSVSYTYLRSGVYWANFKLKNGKHISSFKYLVRVFKNRAPIVKSVMLSSNSGIVPFKLTVYVNAYDPDDFKKRDYGIKYVSYFFGTSNTPETVKSGGDMFYASFIYKKPGLYNVKVKVCDFDDKCSRKYVGNVIVNSSLSDFALVLKKKYSLTSDLKNIRFYKNLVLTVAGEGSVTLFKKNSGYMSPVTNFQISNVNDALLLDNSYIIVASENGLYQCDLLLNKCFLRIAGSFDKIERFSSSNRNYLVISGYYDGWGIGILPVIGGYLDLSNLKWVFTNGKVLDFKIIDNLLFLGGKFDLLKVFSFSTTDDHFYPAITVPVPTTGLSVLSPRKEKEKLHFEMVSFVTSTVRRSCVAYLSRYPDPDSPEVVFSDSGHEITSVTYAGGQKVVIEDYNGNLCPENITATYRTGYEVFSGWYGKGIAVVEIGSALRKFKIVNNECLRNETCNLQPISYNYKIGKVVYWRDDVLAITLGSSGVVFESVRRRDFPQFIQRCDSFNSSSLGNLCTSKDDVYENYAYSFRITGSELVVADGRGGMTYYKMSDSKVISEDLSNSVVWGNGLHIVSSDNNKFLVTGEAGELYLYSLFPGAITFTASYYDGWVEKCDGSFKYPTDPMKSHFFVVDGSIEKNIVAVSLDNPIDNSSDRIDIFKISNKRFVRLESLCNLRNLEAIVLQGNKVFFASDTGIYEWDYSFGNYYDRYPVAFLSGIPEKLLFSPDYRFLVGWLNNGIDVFEATNDKFLKLSTSIGKDSYYDVKFFRGNQLLLADSKSIYGYDITQDVMKWSVDLSRFIGENNFIISTAYDDNYIYVLTTAEENNLVVLKTNTDIPEFVSVKNVTGYYLLFWKRILLVNDSNYFYLYEK